MNSSSNDDRSKLVSLHGVEVLVVDDLEETRILIAHHLRTWGAIPTMAENGIEGFQIAMEGDFHLVLMDIQMPVLDGYGATTKLRAEGFTKPIIAMTSHVITEVRQKCLDAGCTDHLAKPLDFEVLNHKIDRYVKMTRENKS